jgi:hypothetical protein
MSELNIKDMKPEQAQHFTDKDYHISLKLDGTMIYFINGKLFSPRCDRGDRFKHILDILVKNKFPNCIGEMYIDKKGSCVFDVSRSENWSKAVFMPFHLVDNTKSFDEGQEILAQKVKELNNPFIKPMIKFRSFIEGWDYVKENESEGLVLRNSREWFKVKILKELKEEIVGHEVGTSPKGTFTLASGNRVSGTSISFVQQFFNIKSQGKTPIMELEFAFTTDEGKYFQPRCRRVYPKGEEI